MKEAIKITGIDKEIAPMGFGAWQIGDRLFWDYGKTHQQNDSRDAFMVSISRGINFIDTAEVYGFGKSENLVGEFLNGAEESLIVATKYFPYPWRLTKQNVLSAFQGSLRRLGLDYIDLYQIHWPFMSYRMKSWAEGLTEIVKSGLSRAVGVSNFNKSQTERMYGLLQERGVNLASNQVEYNLLNRGIERNGLMTLCRDLGIMIIAYSPIAQGLLTGKYNDQNPPSGIRRIRYRSLNLDRLQTLIDVLQNVGEKHGGHTPSQVAINWLICKGVLPIPGAKTKRQALENLGALGWRLEDQDVEKIDDVSDWFNSRDEF